MAMKKLPYVFSTPCNIFILQFELVPDGISRRLFVQECLREVEQDMEHSFAVARSRDKTCGICMETVLDKPKGEARYLQ